MANKTPGLGDRLYQYVLDNSLREPEILQQLRQATAAEEMAEMRSAPEQGQFMAMLLRLINARRAIEVGTYTGYATLWMALALPEDGEIIACDTSKEWTSVAKRFWEEAGVQDRVSLHLRPALETLNELLEQGEAGKFDFAFIDADKINYEGYFERCLALIRPGGLIAVDNVLWGGSVADPKKKDEATEAIRAFNKKRKNDPRIELSMLPVADGLTLAIKRGNTDRPEAA